MKIILHLRSADAAGTGEHEQIHPLRVLKSLEEVH